MFFIGQRVISNYTGLAYVFVGYDEPTLDGAEVGLLQSTYDAANIFPALIETISEES